METDEKSAGTNHERITDQLDDTTKNIESQPGEQQTSPEATSNNSAVDRHAMKNVKKQGDMNSVTGE